MDALHSQLGDLVRWLGSQREVARQLRKPQRQVWGWLRGEHSVRLSNRAAIAEAWRDIRPIAEEAHDDPVTISLLLSSRRASATPPKLIALPPRRRRDWAEFGGDDSGVPDELGGYFVPIEDYGARHAAGALARSRPAAPKR